VIPKTAPVSRPALVACLCALAVAASADCLLSLKTAPPDAAAYLDGAPLALRSGVNGARVARIAGGSHELILLADGCVAERLRLEARGGELRVEAKLERAGSPLARAGFGATGPRPKSVSFTPDGSLLVCPLLSGRGADLLDAYSLAWRGRLEPPESYAKHEGFVESAFLPALGEIWVSQMHNSTIHAFDLATHAWKAGFPSGGSYPKVIAPSPDGTKVYISNWVSEDVTVLDARSHELIRRVKVGAIPRGLAPTADGKGVFIACFGGGAILRLEVGSWKLSTFRAADGGAKRHLVLDEARQRLYATDMSRDSLFVIDAVTGGLVAEIPIGSNPNTCALSPDGRWIYACTRGPNGTAGYELPGPLAGELVAIDAANLEVAYRQWGGNQPTGLAVSPDGRRLVFTDFLDRRVEAYDLGRPLAPALGSRKGALE